MKVAILYSTFLDHNGEERVIGGIETYLLNLSVVFLEMGLEPTVYQWANCNFEISIDGINVKGVKVLHLPYNKRPAALFSAAVSDLDPDNDIVIFGTDSQSVCSKYRRAISIQHGISWDLPAYLLTRYRLFHRSPMGNLYKGWLRLRFLKFYKNCLNRVCVDYNFPNWFRTYLVSDTPGRDWVIPNFTHIPPAERVADRDWNSQTKKILFARRFCEHRGTRIIAEATKRILNDHEHSNITFAGEGPDEKWMRNYFAGHARVNFIKYYPKDALEIHLQHHISVTPSIASEGTSLSIAEAMACGCAVVATNVGGITNMVIDNYNGLLVSPNAKEITLALERLLSNPQLIRQLGTRAYDVAVNSFSYGKWRDHWREVIETISQDKN